MEQSPNSTFESKATGWRRDLTLDANGTSYFLAPHEGTYWVINATAQGITLIQGKKNVGSGLTISASSVLKIECDLQEEIGITGGLAGSIINVTDEFDVKPLVLSKDVLGKVILADSSGVVLGITNSALNVFFTGNGFQNMPVTVGTASIQLTTALSIFAIQNAGATNIFLGNSSTVAISGAGQGYKLAAGQSLTFSIAWKAPVWAISDAAGGLVVSLQA